MARGKFSKKLIDMAEAALRNEEKAADVGFDVKGWYHGGSGPGPMTEVDPSRLGSVTGTPAAQEAFFLTRESDIAGGFAKHASKKTGQPAQVHEFFYRPGKETVVIDWDEYYPGLSLRSNNGQRVLASLLQDVKEQGGAGVLIKNADDSVEGGKGSILAVLDPSRLRYPGAEFDPKKLGSRNLLAGTLPAAIGIGAAIKNENAEAAFREPKGEFAKQLLARWIEQNPIGALAQAEFFAKDVGSIQAPKHQWALDAAEWFRKYNEARGKKLAPIADAILPIGEAPAELMEKVGYGDKVSYWDVLKAELGLL